MKTIQVAACLSLIVGCLAVPAPPMQHVSRIGSLPVTYGQLRVVNGGEANPFQFPWQAALLTSGKFFCGASVIGLQWVLTAGHCVDSFADFEVAVGGLRLPDGSSESTRQTFTTKDKYQHPQFDMTFLDNDIAMLKLPSEIKTSIFVRPVALPSYSMAMMDLAGKTAFISGWGKTSDDSQQASPVLKYTSLSILPNSECEVVYGNTMLGNKLCLSAQDGNSVCQGDSGSALIMREEDGTGELVQIGITSFVSDEGCTVKMPQGFTRVSSFLEFIEDTTGIAIND